MNRADYMNQLSRCLASLPPDERAAALEYYNEFFEEAGPEREREIIRELGTPSQVAASILAGTGGWHSGPAGATVFSPSITPPVPPSYRQRGSIPWWGVALIAVFTFPIWFTVLVLALALFLVALGLLFALSVTTLALLFGGAVGLGGWLVQALGGGLPAFITVPSGLWGLGVCLSCLGAGLLALAFAIWLFGTGLPWAIHWIQETWNTYRHKREESK